jgi:uncharacterized protein (TIGR02145 family)
MKIFCLIIGTILISLNLFAQPPQKMSYQCVIRNSSGVLVTNHSVGIRISILQGTATGTIVYQEIYNPDPQTNTNGLLSIEIGGGLAITGAFYAIDWAAGPYFLEIETDPTSGTNYTIVGTSQLLSVPYAMYAKTAGNAFSGNYYDLTNKPVLFSGNYNDLTNKPTIFDGAWANITGKPTTLSGYGISDAMSTSHIANGISPVMINNWNMAFSWGNHAGLYRPISYVPSWGEITNKPTTLIGYGIIDAVNTAGNQTIAGNKTFIATISASSLNITNVANPVNAQDAATKDYVDALETQLAMMKNTIKAGGFVTDIDGNTYNIVTIGTQVWMAENLKTTKYRNGDLIGTTSPATLDISSEAAAKYQWAFNGDESFVPIYGRFYTWNTVADSRNICPVGWHIPGDAEWTILTVNLSGDGFKLKESGTAHWTSPNTGSTNESGFTALPGGTRFNSYSFFCNIGVIGNWWTSSELDNSSAYGRFINNVSSVVSISGYIKSTGLSVRCLKD